MVFALNSTLMYRVSFSSLAPIRKGDGFIFILENKSVPFLVTFLQWVPSKELEALYIGWAAVINEFSHAAIIEFKVLNIIVGFDCFSQKGHDM